jgi:alanine dehydrogenase
MVIGVPKEIKEQEQRVALLPSAANQLIRRGHSVVVQRHAGIGSGYPDEEYAKAGAEIVDQANEVFSRADLIVKVKEPLEAEFPLLRKGQILFTYFHLAGVLQTAHGGVAKIRRDWCCLRDDLVGNKLRCSSQ